MPIYEFICSDCGQPFEALVLSTNKIAEVDCPICHSQNISKQISTFASKFSIGSSSSIGNSAGVSCTTGSL